MLTIEYNPITLPEGFEGTPQQFVNFIIENLQGQIDGQALAGQIGGPRPNEDQGIWIDVTGRELEAFDPEYGTAGGYVPIGAIPIGCVIDFAGSAEADIPANYLLCDGREVSQTTYADLYAVIGSIHGNAGGGNFRLPDYRNRVTVGTGDGTTKAGTYDPGGESGIAGSMQERNVGDYFGSEGLHNVPKPAGGPATTAELRGRVGITDNNTTMTSIQQPSAVVRKIIRFR